MVGVNSGRDSIYLLLVKGHLEGCFRITEVLSWDAHLAQTAKDRKALVDYHKTVGESLPFIFHERVIGRT